MQAGQGLAVPRGQRTDGTLFYSHPRHLANDYREHTLSWSCPSMNDITNTRVVLASRPQGEPVAANFRLEQVAVPKIGRASCRERVF